MTEARIMRRDRPTADQRREEILSAAVQCFREKGFHAASMSSIAAAFGMSAGHIYNYFESKDAIIEALVDKWSELLLKELTLNWSPDPEKSKKYIAENVAKELRRWTDATNRALFFEIAAECTRNERIAAAVKRAQDKALQHLYEQALQKYAEMNIPAPSDLRLKILSGMAFIEGMGIKVISQYPDADMDKIIYLCTETISNLQRL